MSGKQKIGNYTVLQTLGVGSFGKVKLAVHSQTGHKVALKIIGRSKLAHSDMIGRVNREIQYLKMLRHPHIIKLYEVITTPTDIIMVIEYAGGELFNYIVERGRMGEKDARRFFQQIVSAVEYCHRRNIVHRDLKPENVLLDPYDNVKVADFGLSNIMKDGEFLQTSCGSPNYAAPEVINGKLYAGPEVDAWSCGVILYVMLCGRLPFDDDHIPALFKKITSGIFTMPGYLSQGAKNILSSLLQVDPLKRMTLAQVRQQPWFTVDLPEYLKPLPESTDIESLAKLDESIINELEQQMELTRKTLITQLRLRGTNPAKVAYQLTLDNRHMLEQSRNSNKQGIRNFALASSPPAAFQAGSLHDIRDRIGGGTTASSPLGGSDADQDDEDDEHAPSSIAILSSSLPRAAGHTLELQMYKMRLRGPHAVSGNTNSAPRVSSPLASPQQQQQQQQQTSNRLQPHRPESPMTNAAQQAIGTNQTPSRTPSNYFRASLPPLAGTPGSLDKSNSSSISSLAHASIKASPNNLNPYSFRNDAQGSGEHSPSSASPHNAPASSPLARNAPAADAAEPKADAHEGSQLQQSGDQPSQAHDAAARRPTVMRKRAKPTRTRWHFGIRSRSPPADVMAEVYRALLQLNMTWKHFNPYHLRAKYTNPNDPDAREVKIDLQLYKLDSRDNYLVDFKAVIPQPLVTDGFGEASATTTYRAGENTLISPLPLFIQAARRKLSVATGGPPSRPASTYVDKPAGGVSSLLADGGDFGVEPKSLDDQFLDSNYPIQLPAELPDTLKSPISQMYDKSDMLPEPDSLPAKTVKRRLGGSSPQHSESPAVDSGNESSAMAVDSIDMATPSAAQIGIPIPGGSSLSRTAAAHAMEIPNSAKMAGSLGSYNDGGGAQLVGGTPRSQGKAPGSYIPGSVVGRVSLAKTDMSLTADGVGAGSGSNRQSQERVVNIFPFFDVCCKLITELAVPSAAPPTAAK